ncbi:uncharacterized protein BDZ99DRAFT_520913 [Mytilinidion resinicola]|uniref:Uncharacterized protein n=1 Tax=Mytilinidion resinicola TaxID=574789 RepID=A0A6A6YL15_9PEZI|nr:uncharacterized protein BDZ99DRAFT_520913 [Mytilinidion resinicola]KAF2809566.1 hypothetical protein BDZ99DRAFT_520913 [Mytilinidion resinicola]
MAMSHRSHECAALEPDACPGAGSSVAIGIGVLRPSLPRPPLAPPVCFVGDADAKDKTLDDVAFVEEPNTTPGYRQRWFFYFCLYWLSAHRFPVFFGSRYRKPVEVATPPTMLGHDHRNGCQGVEDFQVPLAIRSPTGTIA